MRIIPAIDILNNQVVRLLKGDYQKVTVYSDSIIEQALVYQNAGFEWLHLVDLLGSKTGNINIIENIREIKSKTSLKIEFGGGIRSYEDAEKAIDAGVDSIIIGSISVKDKPEFEKIVEKLGAQKIIIAADVLDEKIAVRGWTEKTEVTISEHIKYCSSLQIKNFLCTDISQDGMLTGPSYLLYEKLQNEFPAINLFASGGVSSSDDIVKLKEMNVFAVIVGKAIYENRIKIEELIKIGK